jgi:hypothetical protein
MTYKAFENAIVTIMATGVRVCVCVDVLMWARGAEGGSMS